jgi:suppressor of G2 allele of SKP1
VSLHIRRHHQKGANKHLYPSSSRKKLNWDQLEKEVEEEKLEGDAALNKVFQDIFAGGSEEQRRAMIKSFTESGGTVLSTNWDEVGKAPVKGSPPKGMEAKSYKE